MSKLPKAERLLNCLSLKMNLNKQAKDILDRAEKIRTACNELKNSQKFAKLLDYILMIGNYLNNEGEEAKRMKMVKAFTFDSFEKLSSTKAYDKKTTLLVFLEEIIQKHNPELFQMRDELPSLESATCISFDGINQEVAALSDQQKDVSNELKSSKLLQQNGHVHPEIEPDLNESISRLSEFLGSIQTALGELTMKVSEVRDLYADMITALCQDPKQKSEDFFKEILTFILILEKCHREQEERRERMREKMEKEKEREEKKKKEEEKKAKRTVEKKGEKEEKKETTKEKVEEEKVEEGEKEEEEEVTNANISAVPLATNSEVLDDMTFQTLIGSSNL